MTCREVGETLQTASMAELLAATRHHTASCSACRSLVAEVAAMERVLADDLETFQRAVPADTVAERLLGEPAPVPRPTERIKLHGGLVVLAAAAVLWLGLRVMWPAPHVPAERFIPAPQSATPMMMPKDVELDEASDPAGDDPPDEPSNVVVAEPVPLIEAAVPVDPLDSPAVHALAEEPAVTSGPAMVFHRGSVGRELWVDGVSMGLLPVSIPLLQAGSHRFEVRTQYGMRAWRVDVHPDPGRVTRIVLKRW